MNLTPVRVRGKRGHSKKQMKAWTKTTKAPAMDDQQEAKRSKKHHARSVTGIGSRLSKDISRLLQLPQEVLERVFLASKNLSLPLVNRELHRRLSTESIQYQLVAAAFGPTWDAWYGLDNYELHSYEGWAVDGNRIAGDPAFQSAILACSWAKLEMLLSSYDIWIRQHARRRAYFTIPKLSEERLGQPPEPGSVYDVAHNAIYSISPSDAPRSPHMSMRQKFGFDLENFQRFVADAEETDPRNHLRALLGMHLETHPGAVIPDDLLSGPFESEDDGSIAEGHEKAQRLFWLVRGGACLQGEQTWEVTRDGFKAILQLVRASAYKDVSHADGERRLTLAMQLFLLFDILGVFESQWPRYILETNLGVVTGLIPTVPSDSKQESQLAMFAVYLRNRRRTHGHHGGRWSHLAAEPNLAPRAETRSLVHGCYRLLRAELFLRAQTVTGSQTSSAGDIKATMQEPWSDFGME
ncbi:unnamed protein product [Discula destructiva]